jgi:hypothetical protein
MALRDKVFLGFLVFLCLMVLSSEAGTFEDYSEDEGEDSIWKRLDNDQDDSTIRRVSGQDESTIRRKKQERTTRLDECVLFKGNDSYAALTSESYLDLGYYDIPATRDFEIAFEVLPDRINHNGPLFSIGTDEFEYYEWKTDAVKTQFLVVEFVYSAMAMLLKALHVPHMFQLEIYKTFPNPYDIDDAMWHNVRAYRDDPVYESAAWHLHLDDLYTNVSIAPRTNVDLYDRPAYLGGRPGFRHFQFKGIIRNLYINGERVQLSGKATYGLTEVWHCSAPEVQRFVEEIQVSQRRRSPFRPRTPTTSPSPRRMKSLGGRRAKTRSSDSNER